jgi:hypothetical protein
MASKLKYTGKYLAMTLPDIDGAVMEAGLAIEAP